MGEARHRVGVVGTSWWSDLEHLPGLRARGDVEVAALCGRNPERLAEMAARHGAARTFTDWTEMLSSGGLDAVVLATPNDLHHPQALAAIEAGLHVICEKPLALDAGQAREMASRAEAAGRKTLTFFTHRAVAAATHVKRLVDDGFIGRLVQVSAAYLTASHLEEKPLAWRMMRARSGTGALGDIGSHVVDMVRWWAGDVARVVAQWQTLHRAADADESCSFLAELASGAQAVFQASKLVAGRGNWQRIELNGTRRTLVYEAEPGFDPTWEGRVLVGNAERAGLEVLPLPGELTRGLDGPDVRADRNEAYRRLTDPFFAAIRGGGGRPRPDFADGAAVQAVLDAVARSAEERRWVEVG